ncbi:hypothetical protein RHMOL_Rhmol13G0028400 [Rhododendron molle]|uniref:Uncharacterized protein n=1 Tax=Rhododendron molle TaxID=49168 RepID=A0ACC0L3N3_RHOML|nr:hypothetical protein RHMOL_Rhmol13G0028400 [Rhododendron molle]
MDDGEDKRITSGSSGGGYGVVLLPSDIVEAEVLTRLPVKSLMRFKCVSKLGRSTISHPSFSKAYLGRRRQSGLFITYPVVGSLRCLYATLPVGGESALLHEQFNLPDSFANYKYNQNGATQVINGGLFCVYADYRAWICNVSTGEIRELPASDLQDAKAFHYYFGFASSSKEYKLLKLCSAPIDCVCMDGYGPWAMECEILTLGKDASWRRWRRPDAPRVDIFKQSVHIIDGGVICFWHRDGQRLIVFNFQDESFHVINPPRRVSSSLRGYFLLQLGGHFALVKEKKSYYQVMELQGDPNGLVHQRLELWVLKLNFHQGESVPPSYEWTYQVINLPFDFPFGGLSFLGNLPMTGEMLTGVETHNKPTVPVYSYDHTTGKFEKFVMGKFPLSPLPSAASIRKDTNSFCASICEETNNFRVSYYEEDITPLTDLIQFSDSQKQTQKKKKPRRKKNQG